MKNKFAFVFSTIALLAISGCNKPKECKHQEKELIMVETPRLSKQVEGTNFDKTGMKIALKCKDCNYDEEITDYTIKGGSNLENGNGSVVIQYEEYKLQYDFEVRSPYRVCCCGDSLTAGHTWKNQAYPVYLSEYLGNQFNVKNCGVNGISITGYGGSWNNPDQRFIKQNVYQQSVDFNPDVFAIMLGTNDATGWSNAEKDFLNEYHELLNSYYDKFPDAQYIMMVSPPVKENGFGIPNNEIKEYVNPIQRQLAEEYDMRIIDFRVLFEEYEGGVDALLRTTERSSGSGNLMDNVHFSVEGAQFVAQKVKDEIDSMNF